MEYVAHRGESMDAPENTLAAFRLAWERGCTTFETDVHLDADGILICCHDHTTLRTTGVDCVIAETPTAQLRTLDAGRWKGERWAGERLPLLTEVLDAMPPGTRCYLEIKPGDKEGCARVVRQAAADLARCRTTPAQVTFVAFSPDAILEAKKQLPEYPAYLIFSASWATPDAFWQAAIEQGRSVGADGISVEHRVLDSADEVEMVHAAGLELAVWTINDDAEARRVAAFGVDSITSDRAAGLAASVKKSKPGAASS